MSIWAQLLGFWSKFKFSGSIVCYEKVVRYITYLSHLSVLFLQEQLIQNNVDLVVNILIGSEIHLWMWNTSLQAPRAKMNQQRSRRFRASKEGMEAAVEKQRVREEILAKGKEYAFWGWTFYSVNLIRIPEYARKMYVHCWRKVVHGTFYSC